MLESGGAPGPTMELIILHHDGREEVRQLEDGAWGIGRASDNWLSPIDSALSRHHALLIVDGAEVSVEGLPSRNGTLLNGHRIEGRRRLASGDEVRVGRTTLRVVSGRRSGEQLRHRPTVDLPEGEAGSLGPIIAGSEAMLEVLETCDRFARRDLPVLITGESGTGKELLARRLHLGSPRYDGPFVVLNCPALAESVMASELFGVEAGVATGVTRRAGRLEEADGGTLFLDEVADLSLEAQAMLLRFLQDGTLERVGGRSAISVDVRVVAATHRDLQQLIADGRFRHDLFYRIATLELEIPPLRARPRDLELLVDHFLTANGGGFRLSDGAWSDLRRYPFPGNVRELGAVVARATILADDGLIDREHLNLSGEASPAVGDEADAARALLERVVAGELDFWAHVHQPFVDRDLSRSVVRDLVAEGLARGDGTVRGLADLLGVGDRYRKLLDFLRNNRLMP